MKRNDMNITGGITPGIIHWIRENDIVSTEWWQSLLFPVTDISVWVVGKKIAKKKNRVGGRD